MNKVNEYDLDFAINNISCSRHSFSIVAHTPIFNKNIKYEFNILRYVNSDEDFTVTDDKICKHHDYLQIKKEVDTYATRPMGFHIALYKQAYDESGKLLPLFMSSLNYNEYNLFDIPKEWQEKINESLHDDVYRGYLDPSYKDEWGECEFNLSYLFFKFFDIYKTDSNNKDELFNIVTKIYDFLHSKATNRRLAVDTLSDIKEPVLRDYIKEVVLSFFDYIKEKEIVKECRNCKKLFTYKEDKKYCSTKCLKASANKRNYQKRKLKISSKKEIRPTE